MKLLNVEYVQSWSGCVPGRKIPLITEMHTAMKKSLGGDGGYNTSQWGLLLYPPEDEKL
jgi:hypothetical protein